MTNAADTSALLEHFLAGATRRNRNEPEFLQAVAEVATSIIPYIATRPEYKETRILERLTEADRIISFRVVWEDDKGNIPCESRLPRAME